MQTIFNTFVTALKSVTDRKGHPSTLADLLINCEYSKQVLAMRQEPDVQKQKAMKAQLPCFCPSGLFGSPVDAKHLQEHSLFIAVDIDKKDNLKLADFGTFKERCAEIPYIHYCGKSCRGEGFFCLIPIKDAAKHRQYFRALQRDFRDCGINIDPSCSDVARRRFVSYDPDPYVNCAAKIYDFIIPELDKVERRLADMDDVDTRRKVEELLHELNRTHTDITQDRQTWFEVLCAIASHFGEDGREYAHQVSQHYDKYSEDETNNKYDDVLRHDGYDYTIASLFHHANLVLNSAAYEFKDVLVYNNL